MSHLVGHRCVECGRLMNPRHLRCLDCNGREFEEVPPEGECRLITYSEITSLPWGIDERSRILGVVEFENGLKALGWLRTDKAKMGMRLNAGWGPVRVVGGEEVYGLTLVPAKSSSRTR